MHRKSSFFSVNVGEIFIIVAGLCYSFLICVPEMRSQLKEKHKRRAYMLECLNKEHVFPLVTFFNIW